MNSHIFRIYACKLGIALRFRQNPTQVVQGYSLNFKKWYLINWNKYNFRLAPAALAFYYSYNMVFMPFQYGEIHFKQ